MLTYIVRARDASLLVIDEPDIYLHSDLQRRLVEILKTRNADVLLATHSTEIISEADPGDLLVVDKKNRSAKRIQSSAIVGAMRMDEIPQSMLSLLSRLDDFRRAPVPEGV